MPNLTGVIASAALGVRVRGVERGDLGQRPATSPHSIACDQIRSSRSACRTGWPYGVVWPGRVEVAAPQLAGVDPERGRAAAQDVLDDDHALRPAEAAERGLRRLVGLRDPAVHLDVRDPVGVVDVAQRPGQHRLGQVEAPAAVGGQRGAQRAEPPSASNPTSQRREERVPLAGHRDVLGAVQPQAAPGAR